MMMLRKLYRTEPSSDAYRTAAASSTGVPLVALDAFGISARCLWRARCLQQLDGKYSLNDCFAVCPYVFMR